MLTQAFQCIAKETGGARSPIFVHRPPKVKSSYAAPRSASMQRPKDGEELRKVEARSTIVAAYSRMGPSCNERQTMQSKAAGAARGGGRGSALRLHEAIVNIRSMLTQAFQCIAKETGGARSPIFVHRPPKVKSSYAAPRSASMQRPKDGEELRKVEARSTIVAAYSRMGPSCKERQTDSAGTVQQVLGRVPRRS